MAEPSSPFDDTLSRARALRRSDPATAYRLARRALAMAESGQADVDGHAWALSTMHLLAYERRHEQESQRLLLELEALLPRCSAAVATRCKVGMGWVAYCRSELALALELTRAALAGLMELGEEEGALWARNNLAAIYRGLGADDRAVALYLENRERSRALGNTLLEGGSLLNLSVIHNAQEDGLAALEAAQQCQPLLDAGNDHYAQLMARTQTIAALLQLGRLDEARAISDTLFAQPIAIPIARAMVCYYHARTLRCAGDNAAAVEAARQGLRVAPRALSSEKLLLWSELALAHEGLGELATAAQFGRRVVQGAARLQVAAMHFLTHEALARVAERRGRLKEALAHLKALRQAESEYHRVNHERLRLMHTVELSLEVAQQEAERARQRSAALEEAVARDSMTGLYNHAAFHSLLQQQTQQGPLAVVMIDVDDFKAYNDSHGHPAGDALLKALAGLLQGQLREEDRLARYGGEEFVLLLAHHDMGAARQVAERLRRAVEAFEAPHRRVTITAGVAAAPPLPANAQALVEAADQALYRAKREGKNRVVVSGLASSG